MHAMIQETIGRFASKVTILAQVRLVGEERQKG